MTDDPQSVEKVSAWTEAELAAAPEVVEAVPERPAFPPWLASFVPGTVINHGGWEAIVRHVGCEEGNWLVLLQPTKPLQERIISRSTYRRLKAQLGKKGVEQVLADRKAQVAGGTPEDECKLAK